jgi:hypothetical protein
LSTPRNNLTRQTLAHTQIYPFHAATWYNLACTNAALGKSVDIDATTLVVARQLQELRCSRHITQRARSMLTDYALCFRRKRRGVAMSDKGGEIGLQSTREDTARCVVVCASCSAVFARFARVWRVNRSGALPVDLHILNQTIDDHNNTYEFINTYTRVVIVDPLLRKYAKTPQFSALVERARHATP